MVRQKVLFGRNWKIFQREDNREIRKLATTIFDEKMTSKKIGFYGGFGPY